MMPRFRFSIAALGFWIALVAANCFFFVELTKADGPSMMLIAMVLAVPVINALLIGLRSLLFGKPRRRAFWAGFEATAALGLAILLVAAWWVHLDLLEGLEEWYDSTLRGILGAKRFVQYQYGLLYGLALIGFLVSVVCIPIFAAAIAAGIIVGRFAKNRALANPMASEEIRES